MTPPTSLKRKFFFYLSAFISKLRFRNTRTLSKSEHWPFQCLVSSFPLMSSKKISFTEVMFSVTPAKYGQVLQALRIWIPFVTSVTGCHSLLFSCWEICWFCSLKAGAYTCSEGGDYALGSFFVAPQDTASLSAWHSLFSTQISCPPARRADILPLVECIAF